MKSIPGRHNCFESINEALAEKGVRLSMNLQFSQSTGQVVATPRIPVEPLDSTDRKAKKTARTCNMLATYCPWCGVVLERLPEDEREPAQRAPSDARGAAL